MPPLDSLALLTAETVEGILDIHYVKNADYFVVGVMCMRMALQRPSKSFFTMKRICLQPCKRPLHQFGRPTSD